MKVVHVVRQYFPSIGGMEEVVRSLARHQQSDSAYEPTIVTLDRVFRDPENALPAHETLDGIPVTRLAYRGSERYPLCPRVLRELRDADLVHVHGIDFFFDYLAATRAIHGKRLVASTHGGFFHTRFARRLKRIYFNSVTRLSSKAYRRIIATSDNDGEIFSEIVTRPRLQVIENGVDIEKFADTASRVLLPTLIYFGRWSVNKGLIETLDVLAALCAQTPETPWRLIIAGREYDLDSEAIRAHALKVGIANRVDIVPGPSNEDLRRLIGESSYYICQSRHEGFGIAPIEAMSAGLLPILSGIPPFKRLIDSTRCGLLLDTDDAQNHARQIVAYHASQQRSGDFSAVRKATRDSVAPYSWKGVAAHYVEQYNAVLTP